MSSSQKVWRLAWAADNIQVNAILPGWFDTELTWQARQEIPGLHERVLARIAQGRWARPEDMAGTAVWLASSASDYAPAWPFPWTAVTPRHFDFDKHPPRGYGLSLVSSRGFRSCFGVGHDPAD